MRWILPSTASALGLALMVRPAIDNIDGVLLFLALLAALLYSGVQYGREVAPHGGLRLRFDLTHERYAEMSRLSSQIGASSTTDFLRKCFGACELIVKAKRQGVRFESVDPDGRREDFDPFDLGGGR